MILNTEELARRVFDSECSEDDRIGVIPKPAPNKEAFLSKSGASIDLSLGRWFRTMKQANIPVLRIGKMSQADGNFSKEHFVPFDKEFILHPGKFALGMTLEWLTIPGDLAGHVTGKSSLGRRAS